MHQILQDKLSYLLKFRKNFRKNNPLSLQVLSNDILGPGDHERPILNKKIDLKIKSS